MSLTFQIDSDVLRFVTVADVTFVDGLSVLRAGFEAARARGRVHLLFDLRQTTEHRSADELRVIAEEVAIARPGLTGRCILLVAAPVYYGAARIFAAYLEGSGFEVLVTVREEDVGPWFAIPVGRPG